MTDNFAPARIAPLRRAPDMLARRASDDRPNMTGSAIMACMCEDTMAALGAGLRRLGLSERGEAGTPPPHPALPAAAKAPVRAAPRKAGASDDDTNDDDPASDPDAADRSANPDDPSGDDADVMIGGQPAARMGDMTMPRLPPGRVPAGPGVIMKASATIMIRGQPAARVTDITMHASRVAPIPAPTGQIMPPGWPAVPIGGRPRACA